MDLEHNGNAVIRGDAKAYRMVIIDEDGNEVADVGAILDDIIERLEALEG